MYQRLRNLREDADITQSEMGHILNISQRAYSHYENGSREICLETLIKFADYFDVSIDYLLERTNNKKINN